MTAVADLVRGLRCTRAVVPVEPQQPPPAHVADLGERFERGPVVRLGRSPFAGLDPAHLPTRAA